MWLSNVHVNMLASVGYMFEVVSNLYDESESCPLNWPARKLQAVKLIFFSDSHLAPKFFKVVANSKKVGRHFQRQTKPFFTLSAF